MTNLFAVCRTDGALAVKRVRIAQPLQAQLAEVFEAQEYSFLNGITDEVDFSGNWKPDEEEILTIDTPNSALPITAAIAAPIAIPDINAANFQSEGIRALFSTSNAKSGRILIQPFTAQQILHRRFSLLQDGNSFKKLTDPAFSLGSALCAIIEDGKIKFKNFSVVKRILDISHLYQEATDLEIENFCALGSLHVDDVGKIKLISDQSTRKLLHAILESNVLNSNSVSNIRSKAKKLGININTKNKKIILPDKRKDLKLLLQFLDNAIYEASLTSVKYLTNSKRPL